MKTKTDKKDTVQVKIEVSVDMEKIKGLLCSAFEGGSNYWYQIARYDLPKGIRDKDFAKGRKFQNPDDYWHPVRPIIPTIPGCKVIICDMEDDGKEYVLDRDALIRGLHIMVEK